MKNVKIAKKILILSSTLLLILLGVSITLSIGIKNIANLSEEAGKASDEALYGARMNQNIVILNRSEYRIVSDPTKETIAATEKVIEDNTKLFEDRLQKSTELATPEEKEKLKEIQTKFDEYKVLQSKLVEMAKKIADDPNADATARGELLSTLKSNRKYVDGFTAIVKTYVDSVTDRADALNNEADAAGQNLINTSIVLSTCGLLLGIAGSVLISKIFIVKPITAINEYMNVLSSGDLTQNVPFADNKDEIGEMAASLQVFKDGLVEAEELRAKADAERLEKERRQERINEATAKFEQSMSGIVKVVASASTELQASAHTLAASAEETSVQSNAVSAASTETSSNIQTVASSTEELSSSIGEITQQVSRSSSIANDAVEKSRLAIESINKLLESAQKIGEVTAVITDISGQTNLLALNATIEAARAGDAGKGFAVVANEVKGLAVNSAQSAGQISTQIAQIQEDTRIAAQSVQDITAIIGQISETSSSIAAAIEQQAAATSEITRNVNEASNASVEVDRNIAGVSEATASTGAAASQLSGSAEELSRQAEILKNEFDTYIQAIRNA